MQLDLLDGNNNVLNSYNPSTALSSIIDTLLEAGTYYLKVDGTGNENTTEYGSLGSYSLQGNLIDITPLPLHKLELKGNTETNKHKLNWVIEADEAIVKLSLEVSTDGVSFQLVENLNATSKAYLYTPSINGTLQYRLNVTFDNGKQYYSNVLALRNSASELTKPKLLQTMLQGQTLQINSRHNYSYIISDYKG
ncbi:MAG: hypothetical protein EOO89_19200, partial [Pedobacter sp.]